MVSYEFLGGDLPELYKDQTDPVYHSDESWALARGDGWTCLIDTCGDIRVYKNGERISVSDLCEEYNTDKLLNEAEKRGEIEFANNNWYEVQFYAETEAERVYLDLSSGLVAFSFEECIEQFRNLMADKKWCADLMAEVEKVRAEYA